MKLFLTWFIFSVGLNAFENRRSSVPADTEHKSMFQINTKFTPMFPDYVSEEDRLNSYANVSWPSHFKTTPETLSKAGFFYLGNILV